MGAERDNEDLKTLGSGLKTARESKGLSLNDVHDKTRISIAVLGAIENGRFDQLPPGPYARNFIRSYADFLGVDSQPILEHFKRESGRVAPPVLQKADLTAGPAFDRRYWKYLALGVVLLLLLSGLTLLFNSRWDGGSLGIPGFGPEEAARKVLPGAAGGAGKEGGAVPISPAPSQAAPELLPSPVAGTDNPPSPPLRGAYPQGQETPPVVDDPTGRSTRPEGTTGPYQLGIEAKEKTWLRIKADHGEVYESILNPGERINRQAREHFSVEIGNAAGVVVSFQGRPLENLGKRGQVVHLELP